MSYANGTTHYNLPQTVGTDKRDWFDTNQAFADVDAALHTASETASGAASDIVSLGGRVTDLETTSGTQAQDIVDIKADILTQGGAITRLDGEIDDVKADALDMICAVDEGTAQVATVAVSEGDYFRYNDVLYIATDDIAIGDTIVPNTNCRATNVATELESVTTNLNSAEGDITELQSSVETLNIKLTANDYTLNDTTKYVSSLIADLLNTIGTPTSNLFINYHLSAIDGDFTGFAQITPLGDAYGMCTSFDPSISYSWSRAHGVTNPTLYKITSTAI